VRYPSVLTTFYFKGLGDKDKRLYYNC